MSSQFSIICVLLVGLTACSSSSMLNIDSTPAKVRVTVKPLGTGASKNLGETPLAVRASDVEKDLGGSGPLMVELNKEGYAPLRILVTELFSGSINLKVDMTPTSSFDDPSVVNAQVDKLFEAQRLIRVRRFDEAMQLIRAVRQVAPTLASSYELEGGVNYLQQRYTDSLDAYRMAAKYNPKSVEAVRMRNLLETALGQSPNRSPASITPNAGTKTQ